MTTATAYYGLDMETAEVWYGYVTVATATHIRISDGAHVQNYYGSGFTYGGGYLTGGTVTGTDYYESGTKIYEITGASASAVTVAGYIQSGDMAGVLDYVFSGADRFNGSFQDDVLNAHGGNDLMFGNGGNDVLKGGAGSDVLNGGAGADTMLGGSGNDVYIVAQSGDRVFETTTIGSAINAGGIDTVKSSISYALGRYVEHLTLTGANAINGSGNGLANKLVGNSAANVLSGAGGNDSLYGNGGNDKLYGGAGNDKLYGGGGADLLIGGAGKDVLTGGAGNDVFRFNAVGEIGVASAARDVIADFVRGADRINLSALDADTTVSGNQAFGGVTVGGAFSGSFANPGELYFDRDAHVLYGNNDADSAADFAIQLTGVNTLTTADLIL